MTLPNSMAGECEKPVPKSGWPAAVALPVLAALLLTCYFPMLRMTGQVLLFSDDMAQGLFSVVVAAYLVWLNRDALLRPAATSSFWALPVLAVAACLAVFAVLANSSTFSRFGFLLSLAGCLLLIGGWGTLRKLAFALSLLLFTFPVPAVLYGEITQPLQLTATRLSELAFETLGFSVIREGNILQLTYMTLSVAEACSGLRSLITLVFFCLVYAYFFEERLWLRIVVVLLACPAAILVNVLRITATGILGRYNQAWTKGTYHEFLGWSGFFVGFFLVLLAHRCIGRLARPVRSIP
jgi:exosortase